MAIKTYEEEKIRAIAEKIREKANTEATYTTEEMPNGVNEVYNNAFTIGRSEGYMQGHSEGYGEGEMDGYNDGYGVGYTEGEVKGYADGKQAQHNEFWDNLQNYGNRTSYEYGFSRWNTDYIRPKYKVIPTGTSLNNMFSENRALKRVEAEYFDLSQIPDNLDSWHYSYVNCIALEEIEDLNNTPPKNMIHTYDSCEALHTIAKLNVSESTKYDYPFYRCLKLVNLNVVGTIGQDGFKLSHSTKLSQDSIISVITHLSDTTSGLSITLSQVAVEKAFGNGNIGTGVNSAAWQEWVAAKSNWTINLV